MKLPMHAVLALACLASTTIAAADLSNLKLALSKVDECEKLIKDPQTVSLAKLSPPVREAIAKQQAPDALGAADKVAYEHTMTVGKSCIAASMAVDAATKAIPQDKPLEQAETDLIVDSHRKMSLLHDQMNALFK